MMDLLTIIDIQVHSDEQVLPGPVQEDFAAYDPPEPGQTGGHFAVDGQLVVLALGPSLLQHLHVKSEVVKSRFVYFIGHTNIQVEFLQ